MSTALFTGDTLFLAGVGRPDLEASPEQARQRARLLHASLARLTALPPETVILPGHTSTPAPLTGSRSRAILAEVKERVAMLALGEAAFLETILARIPPTPPNHAQIVALNEAGAMPDGRPDRSGGGGQSLCRLLRQPRRRSGSGCARTGSNSASWCSSTPSLAAWSGLERTVVPLLAEQEFGLASRTIALSFIVSFGVVKALANLFAGRFSDRIGRKQILVAGWLFGLPVPILIILAPSWEWVVLANVLLGINQGLCWSTTVIMKIDLVGPARRGLAMGLNEAAGYLAAGRRGARLRLHRLELRGCDQSRSTWASSSPWPDSSSLSFFVRDSHAHARHEGADPWRQRHGRGTLLLARSSR